MIIVLIVVSLFFYMSFNPVIAALTNANRLKISSSTVPVLLKLRDKTQPRSILTTPINISGMSHWNMIQDGRVSQQPSLASHTNQKVKVCLLFLSSAVSSPLNRSM